MLLLALKGWLAWLPTSGFFGQPINDLLVYGEFKDRWDGLRIRKKRSDQPRIRGFDRTSTKYGVNCFFNDKPLREWEVPWQTH